MAEEEVVAPAASPVPSDNKRKLEDLQPENTESNANSISISDAENADAAVSAETENKRLRLDDHQDGLGTVFVNLNYSWFCNARNNNLFHSLLVYKSLRMI